MSQQTLMNQGTIANLGMYGSGIPVGILVDAKGPRSAVILGALALGIGYFPIHQGKIDSAIHESLLTRPISLR